MGTTRERGEVTAWREVRGFPRITPPTLAELLDGGQSFRWNRQNDGRWRGVWATHVVDLQVFDERLCWQSGSKTTAGQDEQALHNYLDATGQQERLTDELPWRSDRHLAECIKAFPALRILRQPFGETLLGFLCSATKQIVQIKQMVGLLAQRHGAKIPKCDGKTTAVTEQAEQNSLGTDSYYRLPTWDEIANVSESTLRGCLLGFRARYIHGTAQFLQKHPTWLEETEKLPYREAKERLCSLPGVGEKVADCVLLFGAGKLEAFPVDTWILKTMAKRYGLDGWKPAQVAQFGRAHFGNAAGLAQQYLFAWERQQGRR